MSPHTITNPPARSRQLIALLALMAAVGPLSIDTYLPSLPAIAKGFGVAASAVQLSVSAYFIGLAAGQVFAGPLSDRFGRRPVLFVGFALFLVASAACAIAPDVELLVVARAVQGLGAAASAAVGRAVVRDVWSGDRAARAMSFVMMIMSLAPLVAPIMGGYIFAHFGWRAIFWMLVGFAALILVLVAARVPETNGPERRAGVHLATYFRAYGHVLANGRAWAYLICGGFSTAVMFAYLTGAPFVYIEFFGVEPRHFGYFFALNVIGLAGGNYLNSRLVTRHGYHLLTSIGAIVTLLATAALLLCALSDSGGLLAFVITLFCTMAPIGLVSGNTMIGLLDDYPRNAGAASALFGVLQFGAGAVAGVAVGALHDGTPVAMSVVMFAAALISLLAWLALHFFGEQAAPQTLAEKPLVARET